MWFDENNHYEDIEFATKSFLNSKKIVYYDKAIYQYNTYREEGRSDFYSNDERLNACYKSFDNIPSKWLDNYITYALFNGIAIVNMMIIKNDYNYELLQKVRSVVKKNIKSVKKSQYGFIKKFQIYLFNYNLNLYKKVYCRYKK